MENKILEMLNLQDKLNTDTSGASWREGITNKGKIINWRRCMYMEMAEAIDSISWKHWKNIEACVDYNNLQVELVDIWHFLMSEIERFFEINKAKEIIMKYINTKADTKLPLDWKFEDNKNIDKYVLAYENFMKLALSKEESQEYIEKLIKSFFYVLDFSEMNFDMLYKLYIGKNVLNKFRQDHGYKEGTYIKIWDGKEDNVYMQEVINQTSGFENIYNKLEEIYKKIAKN